MTKQGDGPSYPIGHLAVVGPAKRDALSRRPSAKQVARCSHIGTDLSTGRVRPVRFCPQIVPKRPAKHWSSGRVAAGFRHNHADAEGGTRTHTRLPSPDFESGASTGSATSARSREYVNRAGPRSITRPCRRSADSPCASPPTCRLPGASSTMAATPARLPQRRALTSPPAASPSSRRQGRRSMTAS